MLPHAYRVKPLGQFIVILIPHHLKEVQVSVREAGVGAGVQGHFWGRAIADLSTDSKGSPVQRGVFVLPQLVNYWLDAQHKELVPEVEAELQVVLEEMDQQTAHSVTFAEWVGEWLS